ncbi:MAG: hypothetical protein A2Y25_01405 [Candidatus Melainabacteria bacterium GWF2_37_15]|nr:MAG: hypothetical protein A2Y25_01405 [Candidatus Melainabacteria bacterium GWF2_37_15]
MIVNTIQNQPNLYLNAKKEQNHKSNLNLANMPAFDIPNVGFTGNLRALRYPKAKQVNVISFSANQGKAQNRGLMMHISHLPASRSHIGQFLDPETEKFTQFLHDAKQTHWIINPLTPVGEDLSPYNSASRSDRNKYFINLNKLVEPEYGSLLKTADLPEDTSSRVFTLQMLRDQKDPRFELAFKNFKALDEAHPLKAEFNAYSQKEGPKWLDNNAIYEGILSFVTLNNIAKYDWRSWPDELKMFPENTKEQSYEEKLETLKDIEIKGKKLGEEDVNKIEQFRFEQFLFDKQFKGFKKDLDKKGVKLFVDLAYGISPNGKDVWSNKNIVALDKNNNYQPEKLTGCMPEPAYPHTQMWGQAVWNLDSPEYWEYQENSMRKILEEGCVRLDHFGGLINRGAIPAIITGKDGNEYPIQEAINKHIELPKPYTSLIDGTVKTHADKDIWYPEWLEDVSNKKNSKGETLLDMYIRVAEESGLKAENAFIVEDLGGVCETDAFKKTMEKYGDKLSGLRLPVAYGIETTIGRERSMAGNPHDPWGNEVKNPETIAMLSGSHDPPTTMHTIEVTLSNAKRDEAANVIGNRQLQAKKDMNLRDSSYQMIRLARRAGAKLSDMKENTEETYYKTSKKLLEWMYKKPAKHMQTTISDALGIYFRPNIPGFWKETPKDKLIEEAGVINMDKVTSQQEKDTINWNMKPNTETFGFWSSRFPKGFLNNEYKERADNFIKMMQDLFPDTTSTAS